MPEKPIQRFPFAHTFSIVARDPQTGQMGVAVQSHWFSVGSLVSWGEAGVGVVATQSMVDPSYGPLGLELMRAGRSAPDTLAGLLTADRGREHRQVAMLDVTGAVAAHTGAQCIAEAGHIAGEGFSVQANMMLRPTVWPAMAEAFRQSSGNLADRLVRALEAAQAQDGDIRGMQSAALLVVSARSTGRPWQDRLIDLRVEDATDPIGGLRRLVHVQSAYQHMNHGDDLLAEGKVEAALHAYQTAAAMEPSIAELPFWQAVTLADLGQWEKAEPLFRQVFAQDPNLAELAQRLPPAGLLRNDTDLLARIAALAPAR